MLKSFFLCFMALLLPLMNIKASNTNAPLIKVKNVRMQTSNKQMQHLFDKIIERSSENVKMFSDGRPVLVEGDIWIGLWLETQPMGGIFFGKIDPEIAINNMNIIIEGQREDGLLPAMSELGGNRWYGSLGMNMVAAYGLDIYYLAGKDEKFLVKLYNSLKAYDRFLWKYRDTDGDGCLEQFGVVDTGEDGTKRYDLPRDAEPLSTPSFAIESSLIMSDSYINRKTLSEISEILKNGEKDYWKKSADELAKKVKSYLWDESNKILIDRDSLNRPINNLNSQTIIRPMFMGVVSQQMADEMLEFNLMNKDKFFTLVPFPSIAINDSKYLRSEDNEYCAWSGPSQGLTLQRSVRAFENYGHYAELALIAKRFFDVLLKYSGDFNVQFNPLTGIPMGSGGYGPTMLAALEYFVHLYGVYADKNELVWNGLQCGKNEKMDYVQIYQGHEYKSVNSNGSVIGYVDGIKKFKITKGLRVVTDLNGNVKKIIGLSAQPVNAKLTSSAGNQITQLINPNEVYAIEDGMLRLVSAAKFINP